MHIHPCDSPITRRALSWEHGTWARYSGQWRGNHGTMIVHYVHFRVNLFENDAETPGPCAGVRRWP
jgi:hypothetical protein